MPITTSIPLSSFSQDKFGDVAYEVVGHALNVHRQLGCMFHESIYRSTMAEICGERALEEVGIRLSHAGFEKELFIDLVVDGGCPFELKVAAKLTDRHRGQLIQYLMLTGLPHGKLINFGSEQLEHEFVNCHETIGKRRLFKVNKEDWHVSGESSRRLESIVTGMLRDWGTGLDRSLYTEAVIALIGGDAVTGFVETFWDGRVTGRQPVNLLDQNTSIEVTTKRRGLDAYEAHLRRFLIITKLEAIHWVNIGPGNVTFRTLRPDS